MSGDQSGVVLTPETAVDNGVPQLAKPLTQSNSDEIHHNGSCNNNDVEDDDQNPTTRDHLEQMIIELKFENEYFKSQIKGTQSIRSNPEPEVSNVVTQLEEEIEEWNRELHVEKQTRRAAEEALEHLRESFSEADARANQLEVKLVECEQEIKGRDEKYTELDLKFSRLHKRAKQRIQEVQKEKDDLETQLRDVNERSEQTSSQLSALQQELERTRQQANEALKAMDGERQQLRNVNNKLRDNIEELRHSLEPKQHALDTLQQSLSEKDQMLVEMRGLLQATEEKWQTSIVDVSAQHQKHLESLEMQLAEMTLELNKAAETISSLQVVVAEKEYKIAEMDAASSGEAARLKAVIESVKGELVHQKHEHAKERENWEATCEAFKAKLETAESNCIRAEIETAKTRSQLELRLSTQTQLLNARDAELATLKEQIKRLEVEFSSYKARAHSLLQKKDAEIAAAKDSEQVKALEEALKEAESEISFVSAEKDKAICELQDALANLEKDLSVRVAALTNADQNIKNLEMKIDSLTVRHQSEEDAWKLSMRNLEETWQAKYEALQAEKEKSPAPNLQKEMEELKLQYRKLKEERDSFRDLADRMLEDKDIEISRLLNENKTIQHSLNLKLKGGGDDAHSTALQKQDTLSTSVSEQQILMLARQQAQREEELAQSQRHILALQDEIEELERENRLHNQQVSMLKEELRSMDRAQKREGVDMTYLKNVVLKLLETGEVEALLPVISMLLQFSPDEMQKCQQAYSNYTDAPPGSVNEGSSRSLFSRFSFV